MMTLEDFESSCKKLFGERYSGPLAEALGVNQGTVTKWRQNGDIPGPVVAVLSSWVFIFENMNLRPPVSPGSPERYEVPEKEEKRGRKQTRYLRILDVDD